MSDTENFLSRWSRLKRESEPATPPEDKAAPDESVSLPGDMSTVSAFNPTSLPPIDSIVADSDILQFLQADVPPELTRAALRSAWTADPAIRDFIGIAENQWDFNDHAAMPGFGPVKAADYLAAQMLEGLHQVSRRTAQSLDPVSQPVQPASKPQWSKPLDEVKHLDEPSPSAEDSPFAESNLLPRSPHSHGGALPK